MKLEIKFELEKSPLWLITVFRKKNLRSSVNWRPNKELTIKCFSALKQNECSSKSFILITGLSETFGPFSASELHAQCPLICPTMFPMSIIICEAMTRGESSETFYRVHYRELFHHSKKGFLVKFIWENLTVKFLVWGFIKQIRILKVLRTSSVVKILWSRYLGFNLISNSPAVWP